jgi:hypothetical protein
MRKIEKKEERWEEERRKGGRKNRRLKRIRAVSIRKQ